MNQETIGIIKGVVCIFIGIALLIAFVWHTENPE
jgi:hypothetical protein